ncbi:putative lipoprotein [Leadbettera azotonutricia ZAS-9]|uniref:Putative lipoprotein n=2 Tax=Leadbettera azotonutricia TaxID=150829 RepID=F5YEP2_LEAAZ|nr:putative lipoprotein [Leadbettera azotonutricia ZAS-9]
MVFRMDSKAHKGFVRVFGFALVLAAALIIGGCSTDGDDPGPTKVPVTWKPATFPFGVTQGFENVAYGNGVFVATTKTAGKIFWSEDGVAWKEANTDYADFVDAARNFVFFVNNGFLTAGRTNVGNWAKSTDGKTWSDVTAAPLAQAAGGAAYGNGTYVVGSNGSKVFISTDFTSWTEKATGIGSAETGGVINWVNGVAYGNGKFVITGMNAKIGYSNDNGDTWVDSTPLDNEGGKLFGGATGSSGNQGAVNQVVFGNGLFMAVGGNPIPSTQIAATSSDGITWKQTDDIKVTGTGNYIHVGYGAGVYIIAHESGGTVPASYSTDAFTWTEIDQTNLTGVNGIAYGAGKFVMVGSGGIVYSIPE